MKPEILGVAFTFLSTAAGFGSAQEIYNSQNETVPRMDASDVAATARLPDGFRMQVAAAEPMVQQPIAMAWDLKGRLWVAENNTYAESAKKLDLALNDRIVILEDTDGDGAFDKRTIFFDMFQQLTSIEVIDGGVFALAPPNLYFVPDADRDDVPDGAPQVLVSGFNTDIRHNFANGLRFGPDGWLYGRHGILGASEVSLQNRMDTDFGAHPLIPSAGYVSGSGVFPARTTARLTCGIWRYHPQRHAIEMVCEGTTNPWGMDWDAYGNLFFINTVIGHLWHAIPGSHLQRMYGEDSDPYAYELLPQIADHVHWDAKGEDWRATRNGPPSSGTDLAGGGHAHSGMMIYQADQWPSDYRNHLYTLNLHGQRINRERLDRAGAGFVGRHQPDMVFWSDPWFRGIELSTAPDGSVYVLDWSDIGECHEDDGVHRSSGRIYRILSDHPIAKDSLRSEMVTGIRAGTAASSSILSYKTCLRILQHPNAWYSRELWKALQFRPIALEASSELHQLAMRSANERSVTRNGIDPVVLQLRAIWTLHAANRLRDEQLFRLLQTPQHESVHAWAIRLLAERIETVDHSKQTEGQAELVDMLTSKPISEISPLVRLYTAALLPKWTQQQWRIAGMLIKSEDLAADRDFPLVFWYGTKNMVADNPLRAAKMVVDCKIPKVTELYLRRFASGVADGEKALSHLLANVAARDDPMLHATAVKALWHAYQGRSNVEAPPHWSELADRIEDHPDTEVRETGLLLRALFQGSMATEDLIAMANDPNASQSSRRSAIGSMGRLTDATAREALWQLVADPFLGGAAAESLGPTLTSDEAKRLIGMFLDVGTPGKSGIVVALGSRRDTLPLLLDAVEEGQIARENIDAATWRQFASVADWDLLRRARAINPSLEVTADLGKKIQSWEQRFHEERLAIADSSRGRTHWNQRCASCHKLFGEGGTIGPELTGAQRTNLRYWLENILAPSAVVGANYRITSFLTDGGRVVTGVPISETGDEVTVQTANEKVILDKSEIEQRRASEMSLMPDGILDPLNDEARADLLKYLMSPTQVPAK